MEKTFREAIEVEMARNSCSLTKLSKKSGLSISLLSRLIKSGICKFHEGTIDAVLDALNLKMILVSRDDNQHVIERFRL